MDVSTLIRDDLHLKPPEEVKATAKWAAKTRAVGLEIEIEGWDGETTPGEHWNLTHDGSLRNQGVEFLTNGPKGGIYLTRAVKEWSTWIKKHENKNTVSYRTSMHVHVDVRDLTYEQLFKVLVLYPMIEPVLFELAGEDRWESIFAVPWVDDPGLGKGLIELLRDCNQLGRDAVRRRAFRYGINKYTAFNPLRLLDLGTLEFRHLLTTTDITEYKRWINCCLRVIEWAVNYKGSTDDMLGEFSQRGLQQFAEGVFGTDTPELDNPVVEDRMWNGLALSQDISLAIAKLDLTPEESTRTENLDYLTEGSMLSVGCEAKVNQVLKRRNSTRAVGAFIKRK